MRGLLVAVCDAALREIVGGKFHGDAISGEYADAIPAEFAREVRQHGAVDIQLNAEQAARELFNNGTGNFYAIFFAHSPLLVWIFSGANPLV